MRHCLKPPELTETGEYRDQQWVELQLMFLRDNRRGTGYFLSSDYNEASVSKKVCHRRDNTTFVMPHSVAVESGLIDEAT